MSATKSQKLSSNLKALDILAACIRQGMLDKDIQRMLIVECGYKWTIDTIGRRRRAMGVTKKPGQQPVTNTVNAPMMTVPPHGLSDGEKAVWFRDQFKRSHLYQTIKKQFEKDEVDVYINEFGHLCCQFEDIVVSEFMQIDDFLKHRILINRQLILARMIQREINDLSEWFIMNPKKEKEDKDTIKLRILHQHQMDNKYKQLKVNNDRYDALMKEHQKISSSLAATRRDRLDELKGGKETFLDLVGRLQHSQEERDRQGHLAELTRLAAQDVKEKFRKPNKFPDGSEIPIIMDADTDFGDEIDE